jgi:hypothetical protein
MMLMGPVLPGCVLDKVRKYATLGGMTLGRLKP